MEQLVASGILQTIAIKQTTYSTHMSFQDFLARYERHFPFPAGDPCRSEGAQRGQWRCEN